MASTSTSTNPKPQGPKRPLNPNALPFVCRGKGKTERRAVGAKSVGRPEKQLDDHRVVAACGGHTKWVPKNKGKQLQAEEKNTEASSERKTGVIPCPTTLDQPQSNGCTTTVMIKNIPNQFRRTGLLRILSSHCREQNMKAKWGCDATRSEFDFVYLPMDFNKFWREKKIKNLGYAFVNFTTALAAQRFHQQFHGQKWNANYNRKICEVTSAKIQGKAALRNNFRNKVFWCHTKEYLPVLVKPACDGTVVPRTRRPRDGTMVPRVIPVGVFAGAPSRKSQGAGIALAYGNHEDQHAHIEHDDQVLIMR